MTNCGVTSQCQPTCPYNHRLICSQLFEDNCYLVMLAIINLSPIMRASPSCLLIHSLVITLEVTVYITLTRKRIIIVI